MRRLLRWIGIVFGSVIALAIIAYAIAYALSERMLRRVYDVTPVALSIPTDAESIREGRRLATVRGCFNDCHGKEAEGRVLFDDPPIARIVAPNLTTAVRKYSDAELAVIIRNGIRPDGRTVMVMPAEAFIGLTDADVGSTIAFLRSLPPVSGPDASVSVGPLGRIGLVMGKFKTVAQLIAPAGRTIAELERVAGGEARVLALGDRWDLEADARTASGDTLVAVGTPTGLAVLDQA